MTMFLDYLRTFAYVKKAKMLMNPIEEIKGMTKNAEIKLIVLLAISYAWVDSYVIPLYVVS